MQSTQKSVVGAKKKAPKNACNKKNKNLSCKDNRGTNGGGEPVYRADSMAGAGLGTVNV